MDITNTTLIIVTALLLLAIVGVASIFIGRRQRIKRLEDRFGPEYDRALEKTGDQTQAARELEGRIERFDRLDLRTLSAEEVNRYALEWQEIQRDFVDAPLAAVQSADRLLLDLAHAKGYPVQDFEEQTALISVEFPDLVRDYRALHRIAVKETDNEATTEDMRQAMVHGRALFENLMKQESREVNANQKERI